MQLFSELQRRNVFRVAVGYIVSSWLLIQVADLVLENIGSPDWVMQSIMLVLGLGFPVVVFFSWAYEVTPEGIKRESEVDRTQSITHVTRRKLDRAITAVLLIALGYFAFDKYVLPEGQRAAAPESVAGRAAVTASEDPTATDDASTAVGKSIAVLPFVNMSADKSSEYFSDGLADTVLHMLAQIRDLRVAARTSSFQFRDQTTDIAAIGNQLNVATVLEGSVQRSGDQIRVTAQLIDVSNGYHLWSGNFDRELIDVFAIQDEIASEVVAALKVSLLGDTGDPIISDDTDNIDAYTAFLRAINDLNSQNTETLASAVSHLQEAVRLDPNYSRAHSSLGRAYLALADYGQMDSAEANALARKAASRALDIAPESSEALAVLGYADLREGELDTAGQLLSRAIANSPSDAVALRYFADYLWEDARPDEAAAAYRKVMSMDPLNDNPYSSLASLLSRQQRYAEAGEVLRRFREVSPKNPNGVAFESFLEGDQGNLAAAIRRMIESHELDPADPEQPAMIGRLYLAIDMPVEARRWFGRAAEVSPQHPVSLSSPLFLNFYLQQNEEESYRLARKLLEDGIDNRRSSREIALAVMIEHAAKTGEHDALLERMDNLYPHLFDDPPRDLATVPYATFYAGLALIQSGDLERGRHLMQSYVDLQSRYDELYGVNRSTIAGRLALGDTNGARQSLPGFAKIKWYWEVNRMLLEHSSVFDPLRNDPAFIKILDDYREESKQQRTLLQAMNKQATTT